MIQNPISHYHKNRQTRVKDHPNKYNKIQILWSSNAHVPITELLVLQLLLARARGTRERQRVHVHDHLQIEAE